MVLLGKTYTVQFAFGGVGVNHDQGTPHNPWSATHHVPGGSSSGSAVAVAAGLAPMALGSDTGGSVRVPASLCGTVGLKTTVGRVEPRGRLYPLLHARLDRAPDTDRGGRGPRSTRRSRALIPATRRPRAWVPHDVLAGLGGRRRRAAARDRGDALLRRRRPRGRPARCAKAPGVLRSLGAQVESIKVPRGGRGHVGEQKRAFAIAAEACVLQRPVPRRALRRAGPGRGAPDDRRPPAQRAPLLRAAPAVGRAPAPAGGAPRRRRRAAGADLPLPSRPLAEVDRTTGVVRAAQRPLPPEHGGREHPEPLRLCPCPAASHERGSPSA